MSGAKYANLPDIDTAPDVYETEDVFPSAHDSKGDSSDDEAAPTRGHARGKASETSGREELDLSSVHPDDASKRFRKAERRHPRPKVQYVYPPSPTSADPSGPPSPSGGPVPLSQRLRLLQAEVAALEGELADPTNPLLQKERGGGRADPGELIRGMVDVKRRIEKISKAREGRGKLVSVMLGDSDAEDASRRDAAKEAGEQNGEEGAEGKTEPPTIRVPEARDIAEMDRRVGELEKLVGSSTVTLDELSPLPPPLLPLLTRLNAQLNLLTQPRHIDSISRRIKLLNSEFDRSSGPSAQSTPKTGVPRPSPARSPRARLLASSAALQEQLAPKTLQELEEEQRRGRAALEELTRAVEGVEKSLADNEALVKGNVREIEDRIEGLGAG
ncbi:uncharacterized protein BXZ73DRAFT_92306 [Epithele typhae]|uniref:uncharacterized protein n=1 Tax=Epithele typhae TaxID=378194 RepID=UPI002007CFC0|nr:uncharacterized protein BXZ73DRAFT_92306 [Epithele typhae]KAH9917873.1 hypothetical protein BXZ73DRAFT_92306 [Epithele typhae]